MEKKIKTIKDGGRIIRLHPKEPGKLQRIEEFLITRTAISWPTPNSPGYACFFGLEDKPTLTEKKPLVYLAEVQDELMERFFEKLVAKFNELYCDRLFANVEKNRGFEDSLYKFVRERKLGGIYLTDSSIFEDFDYGTSLIRQHKRDHSLIISANTVLLKQIRSMTPDDVGQEFETRFYAIAALCRVLGSFEAYPWHKPASGTAGFGNFEDRPGCGGGWDGSYQEF